MQWNMMHMIKTKTQKHHTKLKAKADKKETAIKNHGPNKQRRKIRVCRST